MTVDQMKEIYDRAMRRVGGLPHADRYTVRVWDGMDGVWCDVATGVDRETALRIWCEQTENGAKLTTFADIDYYCIFPADTQMLWHGDNSMLGDR
jgi:hypothetical protein